MPALQSCAIVTIIATLAACSESPADNGDGSVHDQVARDGERHDGVTLDTASLETIPNEASSRDFSPADQRQPSGVVLEVDFDDAPLGPYEESSMRAEWTGTRWASLSRAEIIEGAEAKGGRSLRIFYPANTFGPGDGGAQWLVDLPESYDELYCAYWVKFGSGFDFVKGGKIPGLVGGTANTGGDKPTGTDGWSARMMWRAAGGAVQYVYHPDQVSQWGEDMPYDIGGQRSFEPGTWHRVEHRIVMNTPGQKDGIVQAWWNGELALDRRDIRFRDVNTFAIDAFYFSTFFGGGDASWAATKDEYVYFDDFIIATSPITY